jgi:ABC-2 type transport system permease protein
MSDAALVGRLAAYGLRGLARNPRVLIFTIVFPVVLLVLFASVFGDSGDAIEIGGARIPTDAYFTAGIAAYSIMASAFSTLAIGLTSQRESGQLKRLRGTPLPAWAFIAAQVLRSVALVAAMTLVLFLIGALAYDVEVTGEGALGIVVSVLLGTAAFAALGVALTAVTPSAEAASTIAPFAGVLLGFISGVWIPVDTLPDWLEEVGRVFPLAHLAESLQPAAAKPSLGTDLTGENAAVMAAWGIAGLVIAARGFRWEPQSHGG